MMTQEADLKPVRTKSGVHTIFHIDNCPLAKEGGTPGKEYFDPQNGCGPWFYAPTDGSWITPAMERIHGGEFKYPPIYSFGYTTREDALASAEEWELSRRLTLALKEG